jgi:hypothetical protein
VKAEKAMPLAYALGMNRVFIKAVANGQINALAVLKEIAVRRMQRFIQSTCYRLPLLFCDRL